ncbi:MAG: hypothetical protein ACMG57_05330 [Candidatus Dojkabacteria bacterium]
MITMFTDHSKDETDQFYINRNGAETSFVRNSILVRDGVVCILFNNEQVIEFPNHKVVYGPLFHYLDKIVDNPMLKTQLAYAIENGNLDLFEHEFLELVKSNTDPKKYDHLAVMQYYHVFFVTIVKKIIDYAHYYDSNTEPDINKYMDILVPIIRIMKMKIDTD